MFARVSPEQKARIVRLQRAAGSDVAFIGDGVATMVSGAVGGTGVTTYAENMGVMAVTRIYSTLIFVVAAYMLWKSAAAFL